uniref:Uncharacterized protein n=1 Tax=viral metagenome TaxID=1070528 RepID=A0A6C0BEU9_9ZZZZ
MTMLSQPAILASISYIFLAFMILMPFGVATNESGKRYDFGSRLLIVLIMLIPIGLSIYSINCMVVGGCTVWAWIQGVALALWVILFVLASILAGQNSSSDVTNTMIM